MRTNIVILAAALSNFAVPTVYASTVDKYVDFYRKTYTAVGLGADTDLSYQKQIKNLIQERKEKAQEQFLAELITRREQVSQSGNLKKISSCQYVQLATIDFEARLLKEKLKVVKNYRALGDQVKLSDKGLSDSTMGKEWYRLLRKTWLSSDISPEDLTNMGNAELERALEQYRRLQKNMGYEGRDKEFAAYLDSPAFKYAEGTTPQADYEQRQATVYQNISKLFLPNGVQPPAIRASTRGMSFAVDGYYLPEEGAFYFNKAKSHYDRRSLDWLLLHESTPGHHFQNRYAVKQAACDTRIPHSFYSAYVEGWAAYVEEYGHELGLYQTDADELGAVEWNLVRSIRVILDVGINHYDWSDEQAKAFWHSKLPMLPDLADREIKRVRNWPAQAITYKLGAVKFRQLRDQEKTRLGPQFSLQQFHHDVLKYGPLPLSVLDQLFSESAASK
jgi:uncharacterized protein (DUF885 family)